MPIRFRCVYCTRLLGIASRKAGSVTRCPQCGNEIVVPLRSDDENEMTQGEAAPFPPPSLPVQEAPQLELPRVPSVTRAKSRPKDGDEPLFIGDDIDDLLGLPKGKIANPNAAKVGGPKPINGMDAMSLDEEKPGSLVISSQRATLIVMAVVVLLGLTFAAGVFLGMNTTRGG